MRAAAVGAMLAAAMGCGHAFAQGLPATFDEALQRAKQQDRKPSAFADYSRGPFMGYYGPRYTEVFNTCIRKHPLREHFVFVVAIEADGKVARVYKDRSTALFACVEEQLVRDRFPRPPAAPYFAEFRIEPPK